METCSRNLAAGLPLWIGACLCAFGNMRVTVAERMLNTPQPRTWLFVGRTDNGPRSVLCMWEIVEVWLN